MDKRAGSGRQQAITTEENENLTENLICSQEDNLSSHMPSREVEKKHRYKPYFRKANDQEKKQFKCLKRTMMNSGTQER